MKKKLIISLIAVVLILALSVGVFAACNRKKKNSDNVKPVVPVDEPTEDYGYNYEGKYDDDAYGLRSAQVYNSTLGEFYKYYSAAKNADNLAARYALMAVAEAKLYESGILLPTQSNGGNYAVSKGAPKTVASTLWGNDSDRNHTLIVANKPLKIADRTALQQKWNEAADAAAYLAEVKSYLTSHGYELKTTYNTGYSSDPQTWDVLGTSKQADTLPLVNTYDGLVEYDVKNVLQPAMATNIPTAVPTGAQKANGKQDDEGEDILENTVKFVFNIRQGQKWVNNQGQKVADFKASDFVTGFQHMLDAKGGLEWLVEGVIAGAAQYIGGDDPNFSHVGVTADDTAMTVTYEVFESSESYFLTMLSYSCFAPMSKTYYESKGGKFGAEYNAADPSYLYAQDYDSIAYCGPYLINEHTAKNKISFVANQDWWNNAGVNARNISQINWAFNDGTDDTKAYNDFKAGTLDGCGLNTTTLVSAKSDKLPGDADTIFAAYHYTTAADATAFCMFYNINRSIYANFNDDTKVVSPESAAEQARTAAAMLNVHFRRALATSLNRTTYMSHMVGAELAENNISNAYTPGTFVNLPEAVKLHIGGVEKEYAAGTLYGQIVQDQLNADGVQITVFKEVNGEMTSSGFDGWYNVQYAVAELNIAITELAAKGVTIDSAHPIQIDYPYVSSRSTYTNRANALKQQVEQALGGKVKINLVGCNDANEWYYAGYYGDGGADCNYDMYDCSGWGPDYGDPQTYLDTMLPDYNGYMTKMLGIF